MRLLHLGGFDLLNRHGHELASLRLLKVKLQPLAHFLLQ